MISHPADLIYRWLNTIMLCRESMLNSPFLKRCSTFYRQGLRLRSFKTPRKKHFLKGTAFVYSRSEATLLIFKCWIESVQQSQPQTYDNIFSWELATHSSINTTGMVGNSKLHPGADVTAVGLCECVSVCVWGGYSCLHLWTENGEGGVFSLLDLQICVNWLVGTKPRMISHYL